MQWAEHLVFLFPLWLGDMPAVLKGFLEQLMRPGFGRRRSRLLRHQRDGVTAVAAHDSVLRT